MLTAEEYLAGKPRFFENPAPVSKVWASVFKQATRHTRRLEVDPGIEIVRPNESPTVAKYRNDNKRWITVAEVDRFHSKVSRIIQDSTSGISGASEQLSEWLETKPFKCLGDSVSIDTYLYNLVFPRSTEDPNSLWVAFPYNPENPTVSPDLSPLDGGLQTNQDISIKSCIIPFKDIFEVNDHILLYKGGQMRVETTRGKFIMRDFFWIADTRFWYQVVPKYNHGKRKFFYELEVWYKHETGTGEDNLQVPINFLPGNMKTYEHDENVKYNESFMHPFFEYADEAQNRFSDNQAVAIQHAFPKVVLKEIPCQADGCQDGYIFNKDPDGVNTGKRNCGTCGGQGIIKSIDPYSVLIAPSTSGAFDKTTDSTPVLEYISPDNAILTHSYDTPFDLLQKGARKIGLDILTDMSESGVAKGMRLEDLQDILAKVGYGLLKCEERFLWHVECLLNPNFSARSQPSVQIPVSYQFKDLFTLQEEAKLALPVDKFESTMSVIRKKYSGNKIKIRVHQLALDYCPPLLYDADSDGRQNCLLVSSDPERMCIKIDRAVWAFMRLSDRADFLTEDDLVLFGLADEQIEPFMPDDDDPKTPTINYVKLLGVLPEDLHR